MLGERYWVLYAKFGVVFLSLSGWTTINPQRQQQQQRRQRRRHVPNNFLWGDNKPGNNESVGNNIVWGNDAATPKIKASPKPVWVWFCFGCGFGLRKNIVSSYALRCPSVWVVPHWDVLQTGNGTRSPALKCPFASFFYLKCSRLAFLQWNFSETYQKIFYIKQLGSFLNLWPVSQWKFTTKIIQGQFSSGLRTV